MTEPADDEIATLLSQIQQGEQAKNDLVELIGAELRKLAESKMRQALGDSKRHTLQPTDLVQEAWIKVDFGKKLSVKTRAYLFGAHIRAMKNILVEYSRKKHASKRGGDIHRVPFDEHIQNLETTKLSGHRLDELEEPLARLERINPRAADVFHRSFFIGWSNKETATSLGISVESVMKLLAQAHHELRRFIGAG